MNRKSALRRKQVNRIRIAVVGGGIIGLATARELLDRKPGTEVIVFEKEEHVAAHQSGRNSGVVHAGLYYEPGSLKARLCRRGIGLLQDFARDKSVSYEECGKIVVATDEVEYERLKVIYAKARANGVPGVELIGSAGIGKVEPSAVGSAALHSPQTAIVDFAGVSRALADDIGHAGGQLRLGEEVTGIEESCIADSAVGASKVKVSTSRGAEKFDLVVVCGGLQSDRLARLSGQSAYPKIVPFVGDYAMLSAEKAALVKGLIYPCPDPRYPFLGVHITRRYDGGVMLGPNAFLSMGREVYRRAAVSPKDIAEVMSFPGFWKFAGRNAPAALREIRTAASRRAFVGEASKYMPGIQRSDVKRGPRGVRAQAMDADGSLVDDFVITGSSGQVHVRNAPSPGATSALALAEYIVTEALDRTSAR